MSDQSLYKQTANNQNMRHNPLSYHNSSLHNHQHHRISASHNSTSQFHNYKYSDNNTHTHTHYRNQQYPQMTHSIDDGRYYKDGLSHKHMNNCIDIEDDEDEEYSGNVNEKEMEQLSEVVKNLVVKNKLNSRNAFEVPVIDVTTLRAIKSNDDSSWSKISNVLENSSKVYGFRVDFMADSITKMTNTISRGELTSDLSFINRNNKTSTPPSNTASIVSQSQIINNQQSIETDNNWLQQIYNKHLQKQRINQELNQNVLVSNPVSQNVRRMFDQNGVAGMLMAKLPITNALNIVIDTSVEFPSQKPTQHPDSRTDIRQIINQITKSNELFVFEHAAMLQQYCINKPDENVRKEVMEDCYNLYIDDGPQVFLSQLNDADAEFKDDYFMETMRDQDQLNKSESAIKNNNQLIVQNQNNQFINSFNKQSSHFSNLFQPFQQGTIKENKRAKKQPKTKLQHKQRKKREKIKKQDHTIDFSSNQLIDRSSVLSAKTQPFKKGKKTKQKHILRALIPNFDIQKQTNYTPIIRQLSQLEHHPLSPIKHEQNDQKMLTYSAYYRQDLSQNPFMQNLSSVQLINTQMGLLKVPNIKVTKARLWDIISSQSRIHLSKIHEIYERQRGPISQAIMFLSLLHLGNEKNIEIKQAQNYEIQIINPHFQQT